MRHIKISGGPLPQDIRIVDSETGADLTSVVKSFSVLVDAQETHGFMRATLVVRAGVDIRAMLASPAVQEGTGSSAARLAVLDTYLRNAALHAEQAPQDRTWQVPAGFPADWWEIPSHLRPARVLEIADAAARAATGEL